MSPFLIDAVWLLAPFGIGYIVMKAAGAGTKRPKPEAKVPPDHYAAYQERVGRAYLAARDVGIKAITGIVQASGITTVLLVGLFDRGGVTSLKQPAAWAVGCSLILLVEGLLAGILAMGTNYFGHYFDAHATAYHYGTSWNEEQLTLWQGRSNKVFDLALLLGVASGVAISLGLILLVRFWFLATNLSIL